jgi:type III secretion protein J
MRRVFALAILLLAACESPIQHGLDETSANEILNALETAQIGAKKNLVESSGDAPKFVVTVATDDAPRAMELLRSRGLPRIERSGLAETYAQASLVPSPTEERARYLKALANDIERTLETIEGVVSARVHIVMAESDPLGADPRPRVPAQAAVLLKARAGYNLGLKEVEFQKLVAGSVPGLTTQSVAVVVTAAPEWNPSNAATTVSMGPIRVSPGGRTVLVGTFLGILGVVALLAVMLLYTARRLAAVQRERRA